MFRFAFLFSATLATPLLAQSEDGATDPNLAACRDLDTPAANRQNACDRAIYNSSGRDLADAYMQRADIYFSIGRFENAEEDLAAAALIAPDWAEPLRQHSFLAEARGDTERAHALAQKAVEADPDDPYAHERLMDSGYWQDPEVDCVPVARQIEPLIPPSGGYLWSAVGFCYHYKQLWADAELAYSAALEIDPGDDWTQVNLAKVRLNSSNFAGVEEAAKAAFEANPDNLEALGIWMTSLTQQGRSVDEVLPLYQDNLDAIRNARNDFQIPNSAAWPLYVAGRHEEALEILTRWQEDQPQPPYLATDSFDTLGHVHAALGNTDEATQAFLAALETGGPLQEALYRQGLSELDISVGDDGIEAALRACAELGEGCRMTAVLD